MSTTTQTVLLAVAAFLASCPASAQNYADERLYRFLIRQNQAQLVMLGETGLLPPALAGQIARALRDVDEANGKAPGERSGNYLTLERQLIEKMGPEASKIHLGRSRNDLGATSERLVMREDTRLMLSLLADARESLIALAEQNVDTVIPGYTHAVQAQPTTLAHYLSAYLAGFERDEERLRGTYARINLSPLGAAAFTTSGFPLDRRRLGDLLGFSGLVDNSYDAIMVSTVDVKAELAAALAISSLNVGRFAQQFLMQYGDPVPGLNLPDESVGHSSIMPQKRNPGQAERIRILASGVLGDAQTVLITAHNTPGGEIADIRVHLVQRVEQATRQAAEMYRALAALAKAIQVDPRRTLEIVDADYSVMTELADTLLREAGVPFRVGHGVASSLARYGRQHGKRPTDLTHAEVAAVYREATGQALPLSPEQVRHAMNAEHFIRSRRGTGGPQPGEMRRLLQEHRRRLAALRDWLAGEQGRLQEADRRLGTEFAKLLTAPTVP